MANNRIYLGIDSHSNLAISLEPAGDHVFFLTISLGSGGDDVCKFICTEEQLDCVIHNFPVDIEGRAGRCAVHPAGDEVVFEFQRAEDAEPSRCTLSLNSFERVLKLAKNRAYIV